jgi:Zn-dependent protease with chaperone function
LTSGPTVFAIETGSAWVIILSVSAVTFAASVLLRRLIAQPGGVASALLLLLPLVLPIAAATVYARTALPEVGVWQPIGRALRGGPQGLVHLLLVADDTSRVVHPYALSGSATRWLLVIGLVASSVMMIRRLLGHLIVSRLLRRSVLLIETSHRAAHPRFEKLVAASHLTSMPEIRVLPPGVAGAFALGGRRRRIVISEDLLTSLDPDELDGIVAHELAHLEARDVSIAVLGGWLRDLVAWNPIAHLAQRALSANREFEADRRAVAITGQPLAVASGLLKVCNMIRARGYRSRVAPAFLGEGGKVKARVATLLELADGRAALRPVQSAPYLLAACLVAVLGLQVAQQVVQEAPGAVVITWGDINTSGSQTWSPEEFRSLRRGGESVAVHRARPEVQQVRPRRYAVPVATGIVRLRDVPEWIAAMDRWTKKQRADFIRLRWKARRNWEVTPVSDVGPFDLYRVAPAPIMRTNL